MWYAGLDKGPVTGSVNIDGKIESVHKYLPGVTWRHVPGYDNPADLCSRAQTAMILLSSKLWPNGPDWLPYEDKWPPQPIDLNQVPNYEATQQVQREEANVFQTTLASFVDNVTPRVMRVPLTPGTELDTENYLTLPTNCMQRRHQPRKYSEPLMEHIFRDEYDWQRCVDKFALVQRWRRTFLQRRLERLQEPAMRTRSTTHKQLTQLCLPFQTLSCEQRRELLHLDYMEYFEAEMNLL